MVAISKTALYNKIGYKPHEGQVKFHNSGARFRLANCGRRFGKSTMAARDLEPKLFLPNKNFWIVAPTYDIGEKEFRVIWQDLILDLGLGKDKRIRKAYQKKQGNMFIKFPWNTTLEVRSADHPENLVGEALDWVIMSEAAKHKQETWERFIRPALADRRGGADFPTTPEGYNWLYDLWMLGQNVDYPDYESWRFPSWANTEIYPGGERDPEIILLRQTMASDSFIQEIGADFGSFSGKIYQDWDSTVNVVKHEFRPDWPNYMAVDWGFTNPMAAVEFQVSPQDEIFIWREHYMAYKTVPEHCMIMKRREQPQGYHLDVAFGDAADPEAAIQMSMNLVQCLALPEAKQNWRQGIDLVSRFIKREIGQDSEGGPVYKPAFFVDFSCINTIKEFNNYKAPKSVNGKNAQEMGFKQDDHALDAIRYGLVSLFELGAGRSLTEIYGTVSDMRSGDREQATRTALTDQLQLERNSGFVTLGAGAGTLDTGSSFFSLEGGNL